MNEEMEQHIARLRSILAKNIATREELEERDRERQRMKRREIVDKNGPALVRFGFIRHSGGEVFVEDTNVLVHDVFIAKESVSEIAARFGILEADVNMVRQHVNKQIDEVERGNKRKR